MRILDLFCKAGGAAFGYSLAGFDVVGIDIRPQPGYPFEFVQADALDYLRSEGGGFDAVHASPPCQAYSSTQAIQGNVHPDLVGPVRGLLAASGRPWIIENVPGAPLQESAVLCGTMFGLRTYRHRLFETSFPLATPVHPAHTARQAKMGRPVREGEFIHAVGHFSSVGLAREILGTPWMTRDEMSQCVPPAYTEYIGRNLIVML